MTDNEFNRRMERAIESMRRRLDALIRAAKGESPARVVKVRAYRVRAYRVKAHERIVIPNTRKDHK